MSRQDLVCKPPAGLVQGVGGTPAPVVDFLLNASATLTESIPGQVHDVEGIHDCPCVGAFFSGGALKPGESIHRDDLDALTPHVGAGGQPDFEDPLGATRDQLQQPGCGMFLPTCQVRDAGDFTCAPAASVLVVPHAPHRPWVHEPLRNGPCHQMRLDMGPHGVPRGSSLAGQAQDSGSLEAQLSDRPADRPHTQTRPGSTYRVVLLDEGRDLAGGFAAHPAPFVPPDPHRDPGPGRVDHLHHHTPVTFSDSAHNPGSQHSDHRTLCRAPDHTHAERQQPDGNPPNRRADHTDHNYQTTQSSSRYGETPIVTSNQHPIIPTYTLKYEEPQNNHQPTCEHISPNSAISNNLRLEPQSHLCAS